MRYNKPLVQIYVSICHNLTREAIHYYTSLVYVIYTFYVTTALEQTCAAIHATAAPRRIRCYKGGVMTMDVNSGAVVT